MSRCRSDGEPDSEIRTEEKEKEVEEVGKQKKLFDMHALEAFACVCKMYAIERLQLRMPLKGSNFNAQN